MPLKFPPLLQKYLKLLLALIGLLALAPSAQAANCYIATGQGASGPANWQTYCWIDFSAYNDTTAKSAAGQNFSLTLQDGTVMSFNMKVTSAATLTAIPAPSWGGASVGNSSFTGIAGKPVVYQLGAGTSTITISAITMTPPSGVSAITSYMFVAGDGESTNNGETLTFQTNGANWVLLDQSGPITGSTYPAYTGIGTNSFQEVGAAGDVGAYIVGSSTPTTVTTTLVGGGLQGAIFAVRFASLRLTTTITGARATATDQFAFDIKATSSGTSLASGTSTGSGLGPFTAAALSSSSAIPLSLTQAMTAGSTNSLTHYQSKLTCSNSSSGSSTSLPSGVTTTNYNFGALQFGDNVLCTFNETPFPHLTLQKALGAGGRQFTADQFIMNIDQGATNIATTTTTGSGSTVTTGITPQAQVSTATAYAFSESGSGATSLSQYTRTMACTNAYGASSTALPNTVGGSITPAMGDVVTCTITNTKIAASANLTILKSATILSDPVNGTTNPKYIPGAIVRYTFTVTNTGPASVTNNSVWLIDTLPSSLLVGTASSPIFTQGTPTSALTFTAGTDIKYSNNVAAPASFAACSYTPVSAYDPLVKYVCLNPKGTMAASTGTPPNFTLSIEAKVN
jgi:uncharacterized repeat protein (TIGR01451 family)